MAAKAQAEAVLGARHAAERSLRCWGAGAGLAYGATRDAIRNLLQVHGRAFGDCCSSFLTQECEKPRPSSPAAPPATPSATCCRFVRCWAPVVHCTIFLMPECATRSTPGRSYGATRDAIRNLVAGLLSGFW